jgi:phosphoribosylanthranilate isomerase
MTVEVKICGLKTRPALDAALDAGADYVGLVFYSKSPRNVDLATAATLARAATGRAQSVALVVDADDTTLREIVSTVAPDLIQLHGKETPERVAAVKALTRTAVMKVIGVATDADVDGAAAYADVADRILFDAKPPTDRPNALPGGNGIAFDWRILGNWRERWYMLSGGLTPANVAEAIALTHAPAVDVSSGVERVPGEKDPGLIRDFIRAAKAA